MASLYLNSFKPLALNKSGVASSERHGLPPFIDGSIRREPDLEHAAPVITCLCRAERFTPRLQVGDHIVYMTVLRKYRLPVRHHRVVAVLKAERLFDTHEAAAAWFRERGMSLPNNLMVPGNIAKPLDHSHRDFRRRPTQPAASGCGTESCGEQDAKNGCGGSTHAAWDLGYQLRARRNGRVVGCSLVRPVHVHWDAPFVTDDDLARVFGTVPHTRNPGKLDITRLPSLLESLRTPARPSSR